MATRFELHVQRWANGCGSDYCDCAMRKVFYRGDVPCDLLFVGEAPGKTENILGYPFAGQAGRLQDQIIRQSIPSNKYRIGFTNLVACIPRLEGDEKVEPDNDQMESCKPRLEEIIEIASPRLIFAVGSHARDSLGGGYLHSAKVPEGCKVVHIVHPAWILRQSTAFQGLEIQKVCCDIRDAIHRLENPLPSPAPEKKFRLSSSNTVPKITWDFPALENPPSTARGLKGKSNTKAVKDVIIDDPKLRERVERETLGDLYGDDIPF